MRVNRAYLAVAGLVSAMLCAVTFVTLFGYFQAVESGAGGASSEKRFLAQLTDLHASLKSTEDPQQARRQIKTFESTSFSTSNTEAVEAFRKAFAPVISAFGSKPKEAENRFLLVKKRELMEGLVNAYRREIPNGPIPVRAAYLNILFDTQNSLLNEGDEPEQVYIRRAKERFAGLKGLIGSNQALEQRVAGLEAVFQSYERGFENGVKWRGELKQALASTEKALPKIAKEFQGSSGDRAEDMRRYFLYSCILALVAGVLGFAALFVTHKILKVRAGLKADSYLQLLKEFGREKTDPALERQLKALQQDPDWCDLAEGMQESEREFIAKYQALLAVPDSISCPYFVFGKDRVARHLNREAKDLFQLEERKTVGLDDVIYEGRVKSRDGDTLTLIDLLRNTFSLPKGDVYELMVERGGAWVPYELLVFPVVSGHLAGGKVLFFREIRSEAERVEKAVAFQLQKVKEIVHRISHGYPLEGMPAGEESPAVRESLTDLGNMKARFDEREILWKSETGALLDQVSRQKEILERLTSEILRVRESQAKALELIGSVQGGDEAWLNEVKQLEQELNQWKGFRSRLENALSHQSQILGRTKEYENRIRSATSGLEGFLSDYELVLEDLTSFCEEAKVHAVNMSFVKDPEYREFAARSRAYAAEIGRFMEHVSKLAEKVKSFLASHPGSSMAPYLEAEDVDTGILESLKTEDARLEAFLNRWKESGAGLVEGGSKAIGLLREADKKGAVITQLGETSLIINEQAKGNLERWN